MLRASQYRRTGMHDTYSDRLRRGACARRLYGHSESGFRAGHRDDVRRRGTPHYGSRFSKGGRAFKLSLIHIFRKKKQLPNFFGQAKRRESSP